MREGRRAEFHEGGTNLHGTELGPGLEPFASVIQKVSFQSLLDLQEARCNAI